MDGSNLGIGIDLMDRGLVIIPILTDRSRINRSIIVVAIISLYDGGKVSITFLRNVSIIVFYQIGV